MRRRHVGPVAVAAALLLGPVAGQAQACGSILEAFAGVLLPPFLLVFGILLSLCIIADRADRRQRLQESPARPAYPVVPSQSSRGDL
jgi:hypothetical protein